MMKTCRPLALLAAAALLAPLAATAQGAWPTKAVRILVGSPLSAMFAAKLDKRDLFVGGMVIYAVLTMAPPLLHVLGAFPGGAALKPADLTKRRNGG